MTLTIIPFACNLVYLICVWFCWALFRFEMRSLWFIRSYSPNLIYCHRVNCMNWFTQYHRCWFCGSLRQQAWYWRCICRIRYNDIIMGAIASQITSLTIVNSTVYSDADERKQQSSASLAFVRGIHRWPVNSPHKWPVTRKMFPFDDVIMVRVIVFHR